MLLPQPEWEQPEFVDDLATKTEEIFTSFISDSDSSKVTDEEFDVWLRLCNEYDINDIIDVQLRRHVAKHQTPIEIKNAEDSKLINEIKAFFRMLVKPTLQSSLLLQDVLDDERLEFHRDNPSVFVQTMRYTELLIKLYGKDATSTNGEFFCTLLMNFHIRFDAKSKSEPSKWKDFLAMKPLLCLAGSIGDFCQKSCGQIHADHFSHDDCKFSNVHTEEEKIDIKKE